MWIITSAEVININELEEFHDIKTFRKSEKISSRAILEIFMHFGVFV